MWLDYVYDNVCMQAHSYVTLSVCVIAYINYDMSCLRHVWNMYAKCMFNMYNIWVIYIYRHTWSSHVHYNVGICGSSVSPYMKLKCLIYVHTTVLELIFVRDGHYTLARLSRNDIDEMISLPTTEWFSVCLCNSTGTKL